MKRLIAVAAVLGFLSGSAAFAQTGTARGKVLDAASGQPIPDTKVEISFLGGIPTKLDVKTNKKGEFIQVGLHPGPYRFTATKDGYQTFFIEAPVALGDPTSIPEIKLQAKGAGGGSGTQKALGGGGDAPARAALSAAWEKAVELSKQGKYDEAEAAYKDIIEKNPGIPEPHRNLAALYVQKKDYPSAEAECRKMIELKPEQTDGSLCLGQVLQDAGQGDKAIEVLAKLASDHPQDGRLQYFLALSYYNSNKSDEAAETFAKAQTLDPQNLEIEYYMGNVALQQNKVPDCIAHLEKYVATAAPTSPNVAAAKQLLQALKKK